MNCPSEVNLENVPTSAKDVLRRKLLLEMPPDASGCPETISKEVPKLSSEEGKEVNPMFSLIIKGFKSYDVTDGQLNGNGTLHFKNGHVYEGPLVNGIMQGLGKFKWTNGVVYSGDFDRSKIKGKGRFEWPNGSWYSGGVRNGLRHGYGAYCHGENFLLYTGEWRHGKKHGKGREDYNSLGTWYYEGEWKQGIKHGQGIQQFRSGNIYSGGWKDGKPHGYGTMTWIRSGQMYKGNWEEGLQEGHGEQYWFTECTKSMHFVQPNMYKGSWQKGKRDGFGIFQYASGSKHEGYWKDDRKNGLGKLFYRNGYHFDGLYENDDLVKVICYGEVIGEGWKTPLSELKDYCDEGVVPIFCPYLDNMMNSDEWMGERREIANTVLRHMDLLKEVYYLYSHLGKENEKTELIMNGIQFWQLLRDLDLHEKGFTLAQLHHVISTGKQRVPWIVKKLLPWKFLKKLALISYTVYHKTVESDTPFAACLNTLLNNNIKLKYGKFTGVLYKKTEITSRLIKNLDQMFSIYKRLCQGLKDLPDRNLTAREFLFVCKDLNIIPDLRSTKQVLAILVGLIPLVVDENCYNLTLEMCFLDFFDAVLMCGEFYTPRKAAEAEAAQICKTQIAIVEVSEECSIDGSAKSKRRKSFPTKFSGSHFQKISDRSGLKSVDLGMTQLHKTGRKTVSRSQKGLDSDRSSAESQLSNQEYFEQFLYPMKMTNSEMLRKYFAHGTVGESTGNPETDEWLFKIQAFLHEVFFPAAEQWIHVKREVDRLLAELPGSVVIPMTDPPFIPHLVLSTFWLDES